MQITKYQLKSAAPNIEANIKANKYFREKGATMDSITKTLNEQMAAFGIVTRLEVVHFLAQCLHESCELRYTCELGSTSYFDKYDTGKLAKQLGNTQAKDGDGAKYRGRGIIQITGAANYKAYNDYLTKCGMVVDLLKTPELLSYPLGAIKSACWFWKTHNINRHADNDDILSVTKVINGGTNGLEQRRAYLKRLKEVIK